MMLQARGRPIGRSRVLSIPVRKIIEMRPAAFGLVLLTATCVLRGAGKRI